MSADDKEAAVIAMWLAILTSAVTTAVRELLLWHRDVARRASIERIVAMTESGSRIVDQQGAGVITVERWR